MLGKELVLFGIFTVVKLRQSGIGIQASGSVRYQWDPHPQLDHK
jgi:hypothetical protein